MAQLWTSCSAVRRVPQQKVSPSHPPAELQLLGTGNACAKPPGTWERLVKSFLPQTVQGALPFLPSPVTPPGLSQPSWDTLSSAGLFLPALTGDEYFFAPRLSKHFCTVRLESAL